MVWGVLNTKEVIKFKAVYTPKTYKIRYRYDKVSEIVDAGEASYTSDEKDKPLNSLNSLKLPSERVSDTTLQFAEWKYGACCEHKYDLENRPTWKDLVSRAIYDGKENVIYITAFYMKTK